ncbi:MAG: NADPH-dependent FMN reductase [Patescibacteria group bacterium]
MFEKKEKPTRIALIQGSLNPHSNTALLIDAVATMLEKRGIGHETLDLRHVDMDFCDGRPLEKYNEATRNAYALLERGDAYIIGMPVYSYSISGALKNLIDITAPAMKKKVAGILCNSGGTRSYLASVDLMKILSFEADVVTVQPVIHTDRDTFKERTLFDDHVPELMTEMIDGIIKFLR